VSRGACDAHFLTLGEEEVKAIMDIGGLTQPTCEAIFRGSHMMIKLAGYTLSLTLSRKRGEGISLICRYKGN
jgi:hypothetical protein